NRAETSAQRGDVAFTRLRYREAADHFATAVGRVPATRQDIRQRYLGQEALALFRHGTDLGDNGALSGAIERYRSLLTSSSRERAPLDWARAKRNLGLALVNLGEREAGTTKLDEAASIFNEALAEYTRQRAPADWAGTKN